MKRLTLLLAALLATTALGQVPTTLPAQAVEAVTRQDVVRENMAPLGQSPESQRLREAIERLKATKIKPRREFPPMTDPITPAPVSQPAVDTPAQTMPTATTQPWDGLSDKQLSALRKLKDLSAAEATTLAEALEKTGHLDEAFMFFEQAMKLTQGQEQGYLLLQMAHCKRQSDPTVSQTLYRRVAVEFKDSPWATLASAYDKMVDFTLVHKPQETLATATSAPAIGMRVLPPTTTSASASRPAAPRPQTPAAMPSTSKPAHE